MLVLALSWCICSGIRKELKLLATSKIVDDLASLEVMDEASIIASFSLNDAAVEFFCLLISPYSECVGVSAVEALPEEAHLHKRGGHPHLHQPFPKDGHLQRDGNSLLGSL